MRALRIVFLILFMDFSFEYKILTKIIYLYKIYKKEGLEMKIKTILINVFFALFIVTFSQSISIYAFSDYSLSNAIESENSHSCPYTITQKWEKGNKKTFPITSGSKEWNLFKTHEEMLNACTIPQNILDELSTKDLVDLVLNYPLLSDFYYYDTYEQGLYYLVSNFNGLRELINRKNAIDIIIDKYQALEIPEYNSKKLTLEQEKNSTFRDVAQIEILETILVNNYFFNTYNDNQITKIKNITFEKFCKKKNNSLFLGRENFIYRASKEVDSNLGEEHIERAMNNTVKSALYVTTPNGTKVSVSTSFYNGQQWAESLDNETKQNYPDATLLRGSDNRYNCHSYAWYKQATGNLYWMLDPTPYVNDGSYIKVAKKENRAANNRIRWVNYALKNPLIHSGYLVSINSNGTYTIYSKWGQGPLMSHKAKYSPYGGDREYFKRS